MFRTNITIPTAVIYVKCHGIAYREIYRITWDFYVIIARTFNPRCEILCLTLNSRKSIDHMSVYK